MSFCRGVKHVTTGVPFKPLGENEGDHLGHYTGGANLSHQGLP